MGVYAISRNDDVAVVYINDPFSSGLTACDIFAAVADFGIDVNMIIQTVSVSNRASDIIFSVDRGCVGALRAVFVKIFGGREGCEIRIDESMTQITVMGDEMQGKPRVAAKVLHCLWDSGIDIANVSIGEIGVSMLVDEKEANAAMDCISRNFDI